MLLNRPPPPIFEVAVPPGAGNRENTVYKEADMASFNWLLLYGADW